MKLALLGLLVVADLTLSSSVTVQKAVVKRGGGRRFNEQAVVQPIQPPLISDGQEWLLGRAGRPGGKRSITGLYQSRFFEDSSENNQPDEAAEWREKRPGGRAVPLMPEYRLVKRPGGRRYSTEIEKRPGGRGFNTDMLVSEKRPGGRMALLKQFRQKKPGGRYVATSEYE